MENHTDFGSDLDEVLRFNPIYNNLSSDLTEDSDYRILVPNSLILNNPTESCGLNRIFLVVFCIISRNQTFTKKSHLSVREVFEDCHYICSHRKPRMFNEVIKSLYFFETSRFISLEPFDYTKLDYDDCISMRVNRDLFCPSKHFTLLRAKDYQDIMQPESKQKKENLLHSFLYICAHMCRKTEPKIEKPDESLPYYMRKKTSVAEMLEKDQKYLSDPSPPEAYFESEEKACSELSMSKQTFSDCLDYLCSLNHPLLVKRSLGYVFKDGHPTKKKYPTIYVLNQPGYNAELNKAEKLIRENKEKENAKKES